MIPWLVAGAIVLVGFVLGGALLLRVLVVLGDTESDGELEAEDDQLDDQDSSWIPVRPTSRHARAH